MNQERGLQAAIGIVMAFSILWTLAILVPDDSSSSAVSMQRFDGLVVNGNHYVLDTNVDQTSSGEGYKVIHAVKTPTNVQVKKSRNTKRELNVASNPVVTSASIEPSTETASKENDSNEEAAKQPRMSSFSYAWFALFICYHARNFIKKKNRRVLRYGEEFFVKSGLDHKLEYGLEYEDDYSVDTSFYGSISTSSDFQKFDLDDDPFV
ncbi:hypothetical protein QTG54_009930 [Skeletonema marinoi]|uniref:Transmembrane protein n=1 Tax=Skeletonema marinoi TaxID=267567 RepID=A0AAD8Y5H2_9STRA|nr:hypothetical protein QTG54_009930 [Skeletonema marinoi]